MKYPTGSFVSYKTSQNNSQYILPQTNYVGLKNLRSFVLASVLVVPGTGGNLSAENTERLKAPLESHLNPFVPTNTKSQTPIPLKNTTNEDLETVIKLLNPNISELAKAMHVSRQTIYNWRKGEPTSPEFADKLQDLVQAAEVFAKAQLTVKPQMLRRTVVNNQSFWEIVGRGGSASDVAIRLVEIVRQGQQQRARLAERMLLKPKIALDVEDFPVTFEDDYEPS